MIGSEIYKLASKLWPIDRSLTGKGVRETLKQISMHIPEMKIKSIKSGTEVFDWIVPQEWTVNEAYIIKPNGDRICDFKKNNLHLVGYSMPFSGELSLSELKKHLYSLPDQPDAVPYITSYYKKRWGFCITHQEYEMLEKGNYKVVVDTKLFDGVLNYGELMIRGKKKEEIFLSTYICHPSMANNELSGPAVLTFLAKWLVDKKNFHYSYRIIFVPETIGSIAYLSSNYKEMKKRIIAGFNVSCVGDNRAYSYLPTRNGGALSDIIALHTLKWTDPNFIRYSWLDRGSDERQYCSPGIDLPVASILRTKYGEYPEYHTSLDDLKNVVSKEGLEGGYEVIKKALEAIERNKKYKVSFLCEPQMSKRNLYPDLSEKKVDEDISLMMNLISFCDGNTSLLDISEKLNVPIWTLYNLVEKLKSHNLIEE